MPAALPVLLLGEAHNRRPHYVIERDVLRHVQAAGYDTVALEKPIDFEPALHRYLASPRSEKDYDAVLASWQEMREDAASRSQNPEQYRNGSNAQFLKSLWLAEDAHDLGYRVACVDSPHLGRLPRPGETQDAWMQRRNEHMADAIAASYRQGHPMVVETGQMHLFSPLGHSLVQELVLREVPVEGFDLQGLGSINPKAHRHPAAQGRDVAEFLQIRDLLQKAAFERPRPIPAVSEATWSRRAEPLDSALTRDQALGHAFLS